MHALARLVSTRFHFGWVVAAVVFLSLLVAAGTRSSPSVFIVPLEEAFGWSRATISFAIAVNILLYGLMGPFAAGLMQKFGVRRCMMVAAAAMSAAVASSTLVTEPWHLVLTWGLFIGLGTGTISLVLGVTIVNRWFVSHRGLVMGMLTASTATGQLVFLPVLAWMITQSSWQTAALIVSAAAALIVPLVWILLPERPASVGLNALGASGQEAAAPAVSNPFKHTLQTLARGAKHRDFWLLFASFYICGLSTNGLIGTHLISACIDAGIPEVRAAGLLAMMGLFDLVGTTLSGWLSDRYNSRHLLFWYYGLRGLSLIFLPFTDYTFVGLSIFAVFYGLDWIATVPPTVRLTTDIFGKQDAPILFGWILAGHQIGAATAAWGAGYLRTNLDGYLEAFIIAGVTCVGAALLVLLIAPNSTAGKPRMQTAPAV